MSLKLKIPPPIVGLICALLMWIISSVSVSFDFILPGRTMIALCLLCLAVCLDVFALLKFRSNKTTINPMKPDESSDLVVSGIYKYTRNPMYLGLLIILCSWAVYLADFVSLLLLPVFVWYITTYQIIPEEQILENKFGMKYIQYKHNVRRWI